MPILTRRCECGETYELLEMRGEVSALDRDDIDDLSCPTCGSLECEVVIGAAAVGIASLNGVKEYPYFDRGLGCMVRDHGHHRWLMGHHPNGQEREVKLVPTHGDLDPVKFVDDDEHEKDKNKRAYDEYMREMTTGPQRGTFAKAQAAMARDLERERAKHRGYNEEVEVPWSRKRQKRG